MHFSHATKISFMTLSSKSFCLTTLKNWPSEVEKVHNYGTQVKVSYPGNITWVKVTVLVYKSTQVKVYI